MISCDNCLHQFVCKNVKGIEKIILDQFYFAKGCKVDILTAVANKCNHHFKRETKK